MSEPKPAWASEYPSYEEIVNSWGYEVLDFETFGSWQGDHVALLRDGHRFGLVVIGYGSCTGCDQLEAAVPFNEDGADWSGVTAVADDLCGDVHWELGRDELRDWVDAHPENHWWSYEDEIARYLNANLGTSLKDDA